MSLPPAYRDLRVYYGDLHNHCNISYGHGCVFRTGADILDHVVLNLKFENGVVGQLFYSIFGIDSEDRGASALRR